MYLALLNDDETLNWIHDLDTGSMGDAKTSLACPCFKCEKKVVRYIQEQWNGLLEDMLPKNVRAEYVQYVCLGDANSVVSYLPAYGFPFYPLFSRA